MTDSHDQFVGWLIDGARGDPPRDLAVHASVCESCAVRLGAFDALGLIDVSAAGAPPALASPTRIRAGLAWARLATAVAGTIVVGILVVYGATQLIGLVRPAGGPDPANGVALASQAGRSPSVEGEVEPLVFTPIPAEAPSPTIDETPGPGLTPGLQPSLSVVTTPLPLPTPPPPTPTPTPTAPGPPTSVACSYSPDGPTVQIDWAAPGSDGGSAITGYNIYADGLPLPANPLAPERTQWLETGVVTVPFKYSITALNALGESAPADCQVALP